MKIAQKRIKQIIKEEVIRAKRLKEGYTVPEFETTEDMNLFLDELEVDEEVEQDIVDPADGEVWVMAGEAIQDQDWYEDSERFVEPEEEEFDPTDTSHPDYDWDEHDRLEREEDEEMERQREEEEAKYEATREKVMEAAEQGGEDWAMDTMHDASNNPSMWQSTGDYNQYESPADYVRGFGQDAAADIADAYTTYSDDDDMADLWNTLSDKDPYNTSWWVDSGRPSKTLFKEMVTDNVYGGIERGVQKYIEKYGEWVPGEDPARETLAAGKRRRGKVL